MIKRCSAGAEEAETARYCNAKCSDHNVITECI